MVFDTKTDKYVTRIGGFVGMTKNGNTSGPNGLAVVGTRAVGERRRQHHQGRRHSRPTRSRPRSRPAARRGPTPWPTIPTAASVIVANSNDDPTFINLISADAGRKIVAKIPIPESAENIERSAYHAPSGTFFTALPVSAHRPDQGTYGADRSEERQAREAHRDRALPPAQPLDRLRHDHLHGLQHARTGRRRSPAATWRSSTSRAARWRVTAPGIGGNGGSTVNPKLGQYYHATTNGALVVVDIKTRQAQKVATPNGSRSLGVSLANNRIYLATNAKDGGCGGCIVVFAPE